VENHFQDLLNTITVEHDTSLDNTHTNRNRTELENDLPHRLDTEVAIQSMRNNKVPGIDNIPIKLYKKGR
jgi:hypothetical protein